MLSAILHSKRKAAAAMAGAGASIEQTRRIYGTRLLVRGLLWISVYLLAHGSLELLGRGNTALRVAIALAPMVFFIWYVRTWMQGIEHMDELERRIELEAVGFAFRATLIFLMTIGLLDLAVGLPHDMVSIHRLWLFMPVMYYGGLWRAKRRYA